MIAPALIAAVAPIITKIVGSKFPDPHERAKHEAEVLAELMRHEKDLSLAAAEIIKAEAQSQHWLTSCWRPITMLTFVALIAARWLGWSAPGLSEAEVLKLWGIVELGIGGYTIGRTVEKIAPSVASAVKRSS